MRHFKAITGHTVMAEIVVDGDIHANKIAHVFPSEFQKEHAFLLAAAPQMQAALIAAQQFIENGVALGFIKMPEAGSGDPALNTLPIIQSALEASKPVAA